MENHSQFFIDGGDMATYFAVRLRYFSLKNCFRFIYNVQNDLYHRYFSHVVRFDLRNTRQSPQKFGYRNTCFIRAPERVKFVCQTWEKWKTFREKCQHTHRTQFTFIADGYSLFFLFSHAEFGIRPHTFAALCTILTCWVLVSATVAVSIATTETGWSSVIKTKKIERNFAGKMKTGKMKTFKYFKCINVIALWMIIIQYFFSFVQFVCEILPLETQTIWSN